MFAGYHQVNLFLLFLEQLGNFRERFARHDELGGQVGHNRLLAAQCQTVAVHRNQGDAGVFDVEQRAGMDRLGVGGRNGKEGLVDHRFENALLEDQIRLLLYIGQFRVFLRTQAGDGKFRCTAADGGKKPFVGKDADRFSRNASDDVQQKSGRKNQFSRLLCFGFNGGDDSKFQVVAGQLKCALFCFEQDSLQSRNR